MCDCDYLLNSMFLYSDPSSEILKCILGLWEVPRSQAGRMGHNLGLGGNGVAGVGGRRLCWMFTAGGQFATQTVQMVLDMSVTGRKSKPNVRRGYTLVVICHLSKGREPHFCLLGSPAILSPSLSSNHTSP